jgi:predicted DNA-binding protein (MmcQ/YjbR family)
MARKGTEAALRRFALGYPGAWEDTPWGERVAKVGKKVFLFMGRAEGDLTLSVKLPDSATLALGLPFTEPTGYGLGKSGWVTARFGPRDEAPVEILEQWIDESYRAVAPRKLVATLSESKPAPRNRSR